MGESNYVYEDSDNYQNEIAEIYSFCEDTDFLANRNAFEEFMEDCGLPLTWEHMSKEQKWRTINHIMGTLDVSCRATRIKSCRAIAYLVQGKFGETIHGKQQIDACQENIFFLYEQNIFQIFVQQLLIEANHSTPSSDLQHQGANASPSQIFVDSTELRIILSVLCTVTETMYHSKDNPDSRIQDLRQQFIMELQNPFGDELLAVTLFQLLNTFCSGFAPHYPVKKLTLLLWKVLLLSLGGFSTLKQLKEYYRKIANLKESPDDTLDTAKNLCPCTPPLLNNVQLGLKPTMTSAAKPIGVRRKVFKQRAFDSAFDAVFSFVVKPYNQNNDTSNKADEESEDFGLNDSMDINNMQSSNEANKSEEIEKPNNESNDVQALDEKCDLDVSILEDGSIEYDSHIIKNNTGLKIEDKSDQKSSITDDKEVVNEEMFKNCDKIAIKMLVNENSTKEIKSTIATVEDDTKPYEPLFKNESRIDSNHSGLSTAKAEDNDDMSFEIPVSMQIDSRENIYQENDKTISTRSPSPQVKSLPWSPKVRKTDLQNHLSTIRQKFFGYSLKDDVDTLFGLPEPIVEGVYIMKKHLYVSLAEAQLTSEEAISKYPVTHSDLIKDYRDAPVERLYCELLPKMPQYIIALLKILLAASTPTKTTKNERAESINIMSELDPTHDETSIANSMRSSADAARYKEIIIKSVSSTLILLLKHLKINHIYQFEYVTQQMMFANCIPLILKFLSQDVYSFVKDPVSNLSTMLNPDHQLLLQQTQESTSSSQVDFTNSSPYSRRNLFTCINMVRILNKLVKWKHSRVMMLVVFKSAPTLIKALSIRNSVFQLYVLKLLKMQLKFMGRPWKKNNMRLISAIYEKVRHRLTDDWVYSNDNEAKPWDFQAEEFSLQSNIHKFHQRRYHNILNMNNHHRSRRSMFDTPMRFILSNSSHNDNVFASLEEDDISKIEIQLSNNFESNYEKWLENEVFKRDTNWSSLMDSKSDSVILEAPIETIG